MLEELKNMLSGSYVANRFKGKRTLDIGCGKGSFLAYDPENFEGIDINGESVRECRKKGLKAVVGNAVKLPFEDESFEAINCRQVIEHLDYKEAMALFGEMNRVLRPGGEIALATEMPTSEFWDTFTHVRPYSPKAIGKLISRGGQESFSEFGDLKIEKIYYTGKCYGNKVLTAISFGMAGIGFGRRNYLMIIRKLR